MNSRTLRAFALLLAIAGCTSGPSEPGGPSAVPANISKTSGDQQSGTVATTLSGDLVVKVTDAQGAPVSNARVQWDAATGAGTLSPEVSLSDASGEARTEWRLGTLAGTARVTAQVGGVNPVVFSATALPGPAALVVSLPEAAALNVGDTVRIRTSVRDQFGNDVAGQGITMTSADPAIVSISGSGLVTALAVGSGRIVSSAAGHADTVVVTVLAAGGTPCGTLAVHQLAVGEVFIPTTGGSSSAVCLGAPLDITADYGLVLTSAATSFSTILSADLVGIGVAGPTSANSIAAAMNAQTVGPSVVAPDAQLQYDRDAELRRRILERRDLSGLANIARERFSARGDIAAVKAPKSANVGDIISFNSNALSACDDGIARAGRVAAVGTHSIIVVDTTNPAGGYSDPEYASIAATFDTLVYAMDVEAFGTPTDISGYGKIVLFYTRAVNGLTPSNASFVIGGFFFARDLYPKTARDGLGACPSSNETEMMYLLVPDPNGIINGNRRTKDQVTSFNLGTIAHELQHLINSSRRLYVNAGASPFEDTWLDEALSHTAEELLYYHLSGYTSRQNLNLQDVAGTSTRSTTFANYAVQNFGRLYQYLRDPEANAPYAPNDSLSTRGAAWSFLRYAAGRQGSVAGEAAFYRSVVNSTTTGVQNLMNAIPGGQFGDWLRDWSIATLADDYSAGVMANLPAQYTFPSWNFRSIFPGLRIGGQLLGTYPLNTRPLFSNIPQRISLPGGSTSFIRFSVAANTNAVVYLSSNGSGLPSTAKLGVVRLR